MAELRATGAQAAFQPATVSAWVNGRHTTADLVNIVAVLPGRDRKLPAVALMAHYDTVAGSPGAADDATGVAVAVETLRALRFDAPPARDILVILTDGEEAGLLGARAFFQGHPFARRVGIVINLEARGSSGPALLFETSAGNRALITEYGAAVDRPHSNSLMTEVYRRLPNSSDLSIALDRDVAGLNLAFIGSPFDYHSATDTAAGLDLASLQHMGDQALALARRLGTSEVPNLTSSHDLVHADVFGRAIVAYSPEAGWFPIVLAVALVIAAAFRLPRNQRAQVFAGSLMLVACGALAALSLGMVRTLAPLGEDLYQGPFVYHHGALGVAALSAAILAIVIVAAAVLRRRKLFAVMLPAVVVLSSILLSNPRPAVLVTGGMICVATYWLASRRREQAALATGAVAVGLLTAVGVQIASPQAAFLFAWPTLAAAALLVWVSFHRSTGLVAIVVVSGVGLAWVARLSAMAFDSLAVLPLEPLAVFGMLAAVLLCPLLLYPAPARIGRTSASFAMIILTSSVVWIAARPSPQSAQVLHVRDLAAGEDWLAVRGALSSSWARQILHLSGRPAESALPRQLSLLGWREGWSAPLAPAASAERLRVLRSTSATQVLVPTNGASEVRVEILSKGPLDLLKVDGVPVLRSRPTTALRLRRIGSARALSVELRQPSAGPLIVNSLAILPAWPARAPVPVNRPHGLITRGISDVGVVADRVHAP